MSSRDASELYKISTSTLQCQLVGKNLNPPGRATVLTKDGETLICYTLIELSDWGYAMGRLDLRHLMKAYLDKKGVSIDRFDDNLPGEDWVLRQLLAIRSGDEQIEAVSRIGLQAVGDKPHYVGRFI
uniref:Uncharacterized protein n=1 Tax=Romanomermis culicivorax TaxID=13658 RepID=A0A915JFU5_ROMCU